MPLIFLYADFKHLSDKGFLGGLASRENDDDIEQSYRQNGPGYELAHVSSGQEPLVRLDEPELDLIVLDVMMPGVYGFEA